MAASCTACAPKDGKRDPCLEPGPCAFSCTNGGLFKDADESAIPPLDGLARRVNEIQYEIQICLYLAVFASHDENWG